MLPVPPECQPLMQPIQALLALLKELMVCAQASAKMDYAAVERQVSACTAEIEKAVHQTLLGRLDLDAPRLLIEGKAHLRVGRYPATYYTLAGPVVICRSLYREAQRRNGPTLDPVSLRAGVVEKGWLPHTAQAMAFLMQQGTSREAQQSAKQMGRLPYGRSSFDSVAHALGQSYLRQEPQVEQELIQSYQVPKEATGVCVSLDRVSVPMEEPNLHPPVRPPGQERKREIVRVFHMAYCGTVTVHDGQGRALHTIRYGRMPQGDVVGLCEGLASDVEEMRKKKPDLGVTKVADGAEEMWNLLDEHLNEQ